MSDAHATLMAGGDADGAAASVPAPADGTPPAVSLHTFRGQARAHLLTRGHHPAGRDVTAIDVNAFLSAPHGAPASAGKVAEADKGDVARFLNRCAARRSYSVPDCSGMLS